MNAISPITSSDIENGLKARERAIAAVQATFRASAPVDPFELDRRKRDWDLRPFGPTDEEEHSLSFAQLGLSK